MFLFSVTTLYYDVIIILIALECETYGQGE